jgi:hypothetical protein
MAQWSALLQSGALSEEVEIPESLGTPRASHPASVSSSSGPFRTRHGGGGRTVPAVRAEDEESQLYDDIGGPLFMAVRIPEVPVAEERRHVTIQAVNILHIGGQREGDKGRKYRCTVWIPAIFGLPVDCVRDYEREVAHRKCLASLRKRRQTFESPRHEENERKSFL